MSVTANLLKEWIASNPHRGVHLPMMRDHALKPQPTSANNVWQTVAIEPATPLSCIQYILDPMYNFIPTNHRATLLREKCTELESSFTTILKGRQFPVRKTAEAIIAACTGGSNSCSALGWKALAGLFELQIVWFDETQKLMQFYPEAVDEWTSDKTIVFCSNLANQVWIPPSSFTNRDFPNWLAQKEHAGWKIKYNEAEGTMEELKELGQKLGDSCMVKTNKAELQKRLGRLRAIKSLGTWTA